MKKEKIYNIVVASICFLLLFVPLVSFDDELGYASIATSLIASFKEYYYIKSLIRNLLYFLFAILSVALVITSIFKHKFAIKISATVCTGIYVILWIHILSGTSLHMHTNKLYTVLLVFYILLIIAIVVLTALQYLKYIPPRRPTKAELLQSQIDELQKQVDELKKGD